ncbi:MAG: VOC family protein, partial [Prochlorothrix sp.]
MVHDFAPIGPDAIPTANPDRIPAANPDAIPAEPEAPIASRSAPGFPWLGMGFVAIGTENLADLVDFYQQLLGQAPQVYQADRYGEFHLPGLRLALFRPRPDQRHLFQPPPPAAPPASDPPIDPNSTPAPNLCLCITVHDLTAAIDHCRQLQLVPSPIHTASHGQEFSILDPLGNRILFYAPKA